MTLLPIFLKLNGRPGLLVGAGNVALEKLNSLLTTGLRLRVIAPNAKPEIRQLARDGRIEWIEREFEPADLDGNVIVIAATDDPAVNSAIYREATRRGILSNSVDDPPHCDFYFGSVVRRGDLQVAVSTAGESPSVAQQLRREIDELLPEDLGPWLKEIGQLRREILATHPPGEDRKSLLHRIAKRKMLSSVPPVKSTDGEHGKVYLVGAGPGDPDLLTIKAVRCVESADVILHDDLITPAILSLANSDAVVINVGKRCGTKSITQEQINELMIEHAHTGRRVVRLKSGDPLIFGRAAEEIAALTDGDIPFEVIPGVTAAFAAAAAIPCSLTDRNAASNVIFSTGHHAQSHDRGPHRRGLLDGVENDAAISALEDATRVVYMPGRDLALLALEWLDEGLPSDFPCAIISQAAQPGQQVLRTTLGELRNARPTNSPSVLIAGWAVRNTSDDQIQRGVQQAIGA